MAGAGLGITLLRTGASAAQTVSQSSGQASTNATYYNKPSSTPPTLRAPRRQSGSYYAYSTTAAVKTLPGRSCYFGIYRSADLVTWEQDRRRGLAQWTTGSSGATTGSRRLRSTTTPTSGMYFLFYSARSDPNPKRWFGFADSRSPARSASPCPGGPGDPSPTWPEDRRLLALQPNYHNVNQIIGPDQMKPPATLVQGQTTPLGVYIPFIDQNVFFDDDGRLYLFYSPNTYRNWVSDSASASTRGMEHICRG